VDSRGCWLRVRQMNDQPFTPWELMAWGAAVGASVAIAFVTFAFICAVFGVEFSWPAKDDKEDK